MTGRKISIDPMTRLEGHGKIDIYLDDNGDAENAYLHVPEFRGFEKFSEGRAAEEMPALTQKICGVCPTAHHTASVKTLDAIFDVQPPPAAKAIRELMYNAFIFEDHLLHFYFLGGPDFILGPESPREQRNILGVISRLGADTGKAVIEIRKRVREVNGMISGSPLYPVCGLPGGVSKPMIAEDIVKIRKTAEDAADFAKYTLGIFTETVLNNKAYRAMLEDNVYAPRTYHMGLVDENNKLNFYDGKIRVVDPDGKEFVKFEAKDYLEHLEEKVDVKSYVKLLYLKKIGWKGLAAGKGSGIYRVAPLSRMNASDGVTTPDAQREYEKMYGTFGKKPVHNIFAYYWARLVEVLHAAERMKEISADPCITDKKIRNIPANGPVRREGVGVCEAPRGTLFHHYRTDKKGIIEKADLLVATQNNAAAICLSLSDAAKYLVKKGKVSEGILNRIEMVFRAYDPCLACATHSLPGEMAMMIRIYDREGALVREIRRD
ncbi:MAG: Ni/Fe hydrogenase subunit alpha [Candidatus Omnitrophota bacterium]